MYFCTCAFELFWTGVSLLSVIYLVSFFFPSETDNHRFNFVSMGSVQSLFLTCDWRTVRACVCIRKWQMQPCWVKSWSWSWLQTGREVLLWFWWQNSKRLDTNYTLTLKEISSFMRVRLKPPETRKRIRTPTRGANRFYFYFKGDFIWIITITFYTHRLM